LAILNGINTNWLHEFIDDLAARNTYNPVEEWIRSAPWDGVDRLADLGDTLWVADEYPTELRDVLLKRWMLSATRAALAKREFKARGVLTFQGPQGIGKTSWIASLMPAGTLRDQTILLDHHLDSSNKDSIINAIGHWVVEIGELDSSFKKDIARLKGFLTNDCDKLRKPYGKGVMDYPRRTVFAATVNEEKFLVDQTGNSRWWTISLKGIRYNHDIDMQQLFAQLAVMLEDGEKWWLTKEEDRLLAEYNLRHRSTSVIAELMADQIDFTAIGEGAAMTAIEVLTELGINKPNNMQCRECGSILREHLGPPKRIQGREKWRVPVRRCTEYEQF
jgi:putative DNA primase/helicase